MSTRSPFAHYGLRLRRFISEAANGVTAWEDDRFNALALELFALQFVFNAAYRRICQARTVRPENVFHWGDIPSVPAAAFKELELTSIGSSDRKAVFHSSGTTDQQRSHNYHSVESL